ncbi:MAG: protein translocase subunit SecD [Patescibacteria group bacterium]
MAISKKASRGPVTRKTLIKRSLIILAAFLIAGSISYPQGANTVVDAVNNLAKSNHMGNWNIPHVNFPIVLGLDLQGGTHLEYSADLSKVPDKDRASAMDGVRNVIERRVNQMGVSEPLVQTAQSGGQWRLTVELAGVRDINQAIKMIGETPTLEFRTQNPNSNQSLTAEQTKKIEDENTARKAVAVQAVDRLKKGDALSDIARDLSAQHDYVSPEAVDVWTSTSTELSVLDDAFRGKSAGAITDTPEDNGDAYYVAKLEETKIDGQEIRSSHILIQWQGAQNSTAASTKEEARKKAEKILAQVNAQNFTEMTQKYSEEPGASQTGGDLGWFKKGMMVKEFEDVAFGLQKGQISGIVESPFGFHIIAKTDERPLQDDRVTAIKIKKMVASDLIDTEPYIRTELTGQHLSRATLDFDQRTGSPYVSLQFNSEGTKMFADLTKANVGKPIAIYLDNAPISVPVVNQEITGGQAMIQGSFTIAEAKTLAQRLQAGALPVPITIIAQQSVGPILGAQSIAASVLAGLIGFLIVGLFMIFFYRIPGIVSVFALACYAAFVFALFKLIPVTLSMSGIAGFILSLGIAVDANVLVFERFKEELREGKPMQIALDEGFHRAWPSIRDGNITTLISCFVLYTFTSSLIKGFALTLGLGILVSMFTAMVVTRAVLKLLVSTPLSAKVPWLFLRRKQKNDA